jgi:hypothetical protein
MTIKAPMTAHEARKIVATMQRETPKGARVVLMKTAIKLGNLTDEAKSVYRDALLSDGVAV